MFDEVSRPYRDSLDHTWKSAGGDSKLSLHDTFYIYIYTHTHTHTHLCTYGDKRASQVALLVKNVGDGRVVG